MSFALAIPTPPFDVSRETSLILTRYVELLLKWNAHINLIGPTSANDIQQRHINDSLQLVSLIPESAASLVDLGSGAGLPGMVIAIGRPQLQVTLIEQDQRKAAFLNETKHLLQLTNVTVEAIDLTKMTGQYNVVTARALAPLTQLLSYAAPLLKKGGTGIFPKGTQHANELRTAQENWRFDYILKPSATNDNSSIVICSNLQKSGNP